jgi:serine/threonine protein kinase
MPGAQGDRGSGPLNRPANTDSAETIQINPNQTQTFVQAGALLNDRYLIVRELSSGGFGKVFLAQDLQLHNRPVVVKIQLDRAIDDPWFEKKFNEELRALALIDHPGVVGALDSARTPDGRPFLVMQYVEGQPLRSAITADGIPLDRAANIVRQIGQALGAAHDKGIWHRDLKPENIMLQVLPGGDEHVRLIDFGLATIADLAAKHQTHTRIAGSPGYMAPEQFSGQPSAATDIYAFGVIAYEMITGRKPFVAEDVMQLSMLQRSGVKVKPAALRPGISSKTEKLILHALSYNPVDRPASASAYGEALSQALLTSQSSPSIVMTPPRPGRVPLAWLGGGLALAALAAGAVWMYRGRPVPPAPSQPAPATAVSSAPPTATPGASDDAVELAFWNSIGSSSDPRLYREYLAKYPQGKFASIARLKLQEPPSKAADTPRPTAPTPRQPAPAAQPSQAPQGNLPPLRAALKPEEYGGPLRGNLVWAGSLDPGATLTIQGGSAVSGLLHGDLPRVPATVSVLNPGIVVVEQPSAANQFDRVVLRNASTTPAPGILIRWRVTK